VTAAGFPDDSSFGSLWGLHNAGQSGGLIDADIDAPEAWDITTGSSEVVVFVVDTGVDYTHPDLAANMWVNPGEVAGDGIDNDANGYIDDIHGINSITGSGDPMDDNYHGTHVAGTIGARGNNGLGVTGVNRSVKIGAAKFLSATGSGATDDAIECFNYINDLKNRGINVVVTNSSWGGGGFNQLLMDAMDGPAGMSKILHTAAAGNFNRNTDVTAFYPANYNLDHIISVAATDHFDKYASFSNYGATQVDIAAPGVAILSTTPNNTYSSFNGTSMASPHVAGAAALIAAQHPTRTATQIKADLMLGADDIGGIGTNALKPTVTNSRLNVHQTLLNIVETDTTPPDAVSNLGASIVGLSSVTLTWTATGDDGTTGAAHNYDIRYSTSPITSANWAGATQAVGEPRPQSSGSIETFRAKGLQLGTTYYFAMKVRDNLGNDSALSNVVSATTQAAGTVVFSDGFESGLTQWTAQSPWARTNKVKCSGNYSVTDSPRDYANRANTSLTSATIDLSGMIDPYLTFWHRYELETNFDFGFVEASGNGGTTWVRLAAFTGEELTSFQMVTLDLGAFENNANVHLRFRLQSDQMIKRDGWYIDDLEVVALHNP
jgi:subtilisin family serine protease